MEGRRGSRLGELARLTLMAAVVGLALTAISLVSLIFDEPGWTIGVAIGSLLEIPCVALLIAGVDNVVRKQKLPPFLLFYLFRMIIFASGIILTACLYYVAHVEAFNYSVFGVLIGYTPMQVVVIAVVLYDKNGRKRDYALDKGGEGTE